MRILHKGVEETRLFRLVYTGSSLTNSNTHYYMLSQNTNNYLSEYSDHSMSQINVISAQVLTALRGIALLLFSIQLTLAGLFVDRLIWLLFAGVIFSIIGLIVAVLS